MEYAQRVLTYPELRHTYRILSQDIQFSYRVTIAEILHI